ncbi:MAG: S-layer homology domain-containing protein [Oscillospiraceae bacterium]|nr:S-layer homology domain-containing protein [Oscillospiraceae bacterium]
MKKLISTLIAAAITAGAIPAFASFNDVSEWDSSYSAITELEVLNIVDGDDDGNFRPKENLTRAEFVKLIVAAWGEDDLAQSLNKTRFKDCEGHWATGYIERCTAVGFIDGYNDEEFGPDDPVTYAQAMKMLVSAIGYATYAENQGGWPTGYISYGSYLGINKGVSGVSNDTLVTRDLAAVLVDNTIKVPLVVIDDSYVQTGWHHQTVLKKLDGKEGRDYETLLTYRHNTYIVKGKVTETRMLNKSLGKGQVTYQVEVSDNFDGKVYNKTTEPFAMNIGNTKASDYLFYYTEALVHKDDDDSYTILSIKEK